MPDLDPESLARRAGVDGLEYKNWYPAPAVAAMLAQYRREVLEERYELSRAYLVSLLISWSDPHGSCDIPPEEYVRHVDEWLNKRRLAEKG